MTKKDKEDKENHCGRKRTGVKKKLFYLSGVIVLAGAGFFGYTQFFQKEGSAVKYKTVKV